MVEGILRTLAWTASRITGQTLVFIPKRSAAVIFHPYSEEIIGRVVPLPVMIERLKDKSVLSKMMVSKPAKHPPAS